MARWVRTDPMMHPLACSVFRVVGDQLAFEPAGAEEDAAGATWNRTGSAFRFAARRPVRL